MVEREGIRRGELSQRFYVSASPYENYVDRIPGLYGNNEMHPIA
jgi:hypothetical protein